MEYLGYATLIALTVIFTYTVVRWFDHILIRNEDEHRAELNAELISGAGRECKQLSLDIIKQMNDQLYQMAKGGNEGA